MNLKMIILRERSRTKGVQTVQFYLYNILKNLQAYLYTKQIKSCLGKQGRSGRREERQKALWSDEQFCYLHFNDRFMGVYTGQNS